MIDDGWWMGKIETKSDFSDEHPGSLFMCYEIQWDNGEKERMCPWDLEPIRDDSKYIFFYFYFFNGSRTGVTDLLTRWR